MNEYVQSVRYLREFEQEHRHLDELMEEGTSPFVQQICYGVIRHWFSLSSLYQQLVDKPLPSKHTDIKLLIFCGLYSIQALNRPAHASVNAAVETSKKLRKKWASRLVNGVLRRYLRERESLDAAATDDKLEAQLNHPYWMIQRLKECWPDYPNLFEVNNSRAPMVLRVNLTAVTREEYLQQLLDTGLSAEPGLLCPSSILLAEPVKVTLLPGFQDGLVSVQDEAPQLAAGFLNPQPGNRVLDACAAPGGKTCHLLEFQPEISLTAIDRDIKRIDRITENLERLSLSADVQHIALEEFSAEPFDRILLDVPCSATGIIRRHPDIKLLRKKTDVDKLHATQQVLLNKAFDLLSIGGSLLYSTCSILPEENDLMVSDFVASRSDVSIKPLPEVETGIKTTCGLQLLPQDAGHDGFFYSLLEKTAP